MAKQTYHIVEKIVRDNGVLKGAEIGVKEGGLSAHLLQTFNLLEWISIDSWAVYNEKWCVSQEQMDEMYKRVCDKLAIYIPRTCIKRMTSVEASHTIEDHYLDMVYIDANHSYEFVKEDLCIWYPKIKVGGIISGHDYSSTRKKSVQRAVNEFFEEKSLTLHLEKCNVWWELIK
jgi:hypothetical protein